MTDPLFGSIWGSQGTITIRDDRTASADDPGITVEIGSQIVDMNLAQMAQLMSTLRQAQEMLTARKAQAIHNKTIPLF
jgi:hypothetical protein